MHERDVYKHNMLAVFLYFPDKKGNIGDLYLSRCGSDFYFWMEKQSHEKEKITLKDIFQLKSIPSYDVVLAKIVAGKESIKLTEKGYNILFKTISPNEILCIIETADTLFKKSFFQFHQMVVELTIKIASLPFGKIPEGIDHVLEKTGHFMEADRVYIVEYTPDYNHKSMIHEWCYRGIASLMKKYNERQISFHPWERQLLSPGEHVHIPDVTKIPLDESKGKKIFLSEGIHAVLLLPLQIHGDLLGYIGFHSKNTGWTEENIRLLHTLAQLITNAIIRKKTEEKFLIMQKTISNSSDAFMVIDRKASIVDANHIACERLGYTYEELTRLKIPDIDPNYTIKTWDKHWNKQVSKERFLIKTEHKTKDGKIFPVEVNGVFLRIGKREYHATLTRDITNRIQIEKELVESEETLRNLFNNSIDSICILDKENRYVEVNPAFLLLSGYSEDELLGENAMDLMDGEDQEKSRDYFQRLRKEGAHHNYEGRLIHKSGEIRFIEGNATAIFDEDGKFNGSRNFIRDITKRKKTEQVIMKIVEGTTTQFGGNFFQILLLNLVDSLSADYAFIGLRVPGSEKRVRTISFCDRQEVLSNFEYDITDAPCNNVIEKKEKCIYTENVQNLFPNDEALKKKQIEGYIGLPLLDAKGNVIGLIVTLFKNTIVNVDFIVSVLQIFASRSSAELERTDYEQKLHKQAGILQKKIHELLCFYQIEEYINQKNINEDDFLTKVIDVLRQSSLKPEIEGVKIQIKGKVIQKGQLSNDVWEIRAPIYVNKRESGDLVVNYKSEPDPEGFAELESNEETLLHNIAKKVGFFMERRREELLRYAISKINDSINISSNVNQLCISLRKILSGLVHTDALKLELYNEKENILRQYGYNDEKVATGKKIPENSPEYSIISQQKSLLYTIGQSNDEGIRWSKNINSYLGVLIHVGNKVIGVISVQSTTPDEIFDENDLEILEVISNSVGIAITKKQAEEEIRKLYLSVEQSPALIIITDMAGKIQYVNPKFEEHTGYTLSEVTGKNPSILKSGNKTKEEYKHIWNTILDGDVWKGEFLNRKKNGELYWELALISPIKDEAGEITHFIGIKEDITNRKKMEEELLFAKERAEESDRLKSAFLATMSHELRTPLNAVIGFSDLIKESQEIQRIKQFADTINSSGVHLLNLIEEIFDLSIIESGGVKIYKENFKLYPVLVGIYDIMLSEQMISKKGHIEFQLKVPATFRNISIYTDQQRLKQVFLNLLKNALKFTSEGSIEYGVESVGEGMITFFVRDTGVGISPEKQEIIFDMFRQGDEGNTSNSGGAGLGLFIVKKLVGLLQGNVWLHSKVKEGSTFYFTIPQQEIPGPGIHDKTGEQGVSLDNWSHKTILVAEDMESNYSLLESMLEITGVKIIWAKNGKEAVETCKANDNINLVLMDIKMPVMNGFDATKEIKSFRKDLPILAQTAYAMSGDKEKAIQAGCDDYISKPIGMGELIRKMRKFM